MNSILITGGAGYIGSHTILQIAKDMPNTKLFVFDNFKNGNREALDRISEHFGNKITIREGDLTNFQQIDSFMQEINVDAVIHFAALIEAGVSVTNPTRFFENNVSGSINLFKAMQNAKVKNLVFSSTAAIYGTPEGSAASENLPPNPENPYAQSKYFVEEILKTLDTDLTDEAERIKSIKLRYFNAAGANPEMLIGQDYPKPTHLITVAIEAALGIRDKLTLFGDDYNTPDGTNVRDYIHVEDLARAHIAALHFVERESKSETINIGTGKGTSNLEIVKLLEEIHGKFNWEIGPRRPGDPEAYFADNSKAKQLLNWNPNYSVEQIVKHAYEWKKKYPEGYGGVSRQKSSSLP